MRHYLYLLIFTLLTFVSCETELPEGEWSKEPPVPSVTYQLSVNKTTIVAKAEGSSETFTITSDDSWTVSASETWIKVSDATGAGDKTITVTVDANTGKEARSGSITIKGKSSGTKSISVSQSGKEYSLTVDKSEISVGAAEASETFTITSDDDWTVSASETWIKVSDATGNGSKTITATIEANTSKETRTAAITITGKNSETKKTITVSQEGKVFTLSLDKTTISVGSAGSSETFTITSNDSWTATSEASWVTLSATSDSGDKTITVSISLNSTTAERTGKIIVKGSNSSIEKTITVTQQGKSSFNTNGHEYVDLGLPSGLLWATCNVGASKPDDYGDYFAWGETSPKKLYEKSSYKFYNSAGELSKYCTKNSYGIVDDKDVIDLEDDAAHVIWGGSWRMPTAKEYDELRDINNCSFTIIVQNKVQCTKITSKKNNNYIIFPYVGYRNGSTLVDFVTCGYYWTSSLDRVYPYSASYFDASVMGRGPFGRTYGLSIRPVCKAIE